MDQVEGTLEPQQKERNIYGSFSLGTSEFAISVKSIQEVVNDPCEYSTMPLAPDYLVGLFNLRGMIIPIVDLRQIFDVGPFEGNQKDRKIAIVEHGDLCVGLLFDKTGEVFNEADEEKSEFRNKGSDPKDAIIKGVFKMDQGKRIVQILDPYEILNLDKVPKSSDLSTGQIRKRKAGTRKQCISFTVGTSLCALNIESIQEIIKIKEIGNTALSGDKCLGAIDIRGNTVPVVDFSALLGFEPSTERKLSSEQRIIVMKIEDELFGLLVKSVQNIITYYKEEIVAFPVLGEEKKNMFIGCIINDRDKTETILLNHAEILSSGEISDITKGHSDLYKAIRGQEELKQENKKSGPRKTYLTFTIGNHYALDIGEVNEVINLPEDLITPPNLPKHFKGMINLRGELIPIMDPRVLYRMKQTDQNHHYKVLVFKFSEIKYGMLVDHVDSIISLSQNEKVKLPDIMMQGGAQSLSDDVQEAIQLETDEHKGKALLILSTEAITNRINKSKAA